MVLMLTFLSTIGVKNTLSPYKKWLYFWLKYGFIFGLKNGYILGLLYF